MTLAIFKFESAQIRTFGTSETPLFVAIDVCSALGFGNHRQAIASHVDPEDIIKIEIDTAGGKQAVNCVTEAGLYALIFGSKLESAKRFKRWVTSEVLPAIRRNGQYNAACPATITPAEQLQIQQAVARRAKTSSANYQTIYRALKARFQVPKYTYILDKDFEAAVEFIRTCELRVPEKPQEEKAEAAPEQIEHKTYVVREDFLIRLRTFVYCWRYLFRDDLMLVYNFLKTSKSPLAPQFAEAIMDFNLCLVEDSLAKLGFAVKDLDCYKHWAAKRLTA